jgi:hypothetical protein
MAQLAREQDFKNGLIGSTLAGGDDVAQNRLTSSCLSRTQGIKTHERLDPWGGWANLPTWLTWKLWMNSSKSSIIQTCHIGNMLAGIRFPGRLIVLHPSWSPFLSAPQYIHLTFWYLVDCCVNFSRHREDFNWLLRYLDNSVVSIFEHQGTQIRNQRASA